MDTATPTVFALLATTILVATLGAQTVQQWREHRTHGVARWFFLGQVSASVCFMIYSVLIHSMVFAVANVLILMSALAGYVVLRLNRKRALRAPVKAGRFTRVEAPHFPAPDMHSTQGRVAIL